MSKITTPLEFFGFTPGDDRTMVRWDKVVEYFYLLEKQSDRLTVTDMGPSTEGNPFLKVVFTSPENHKNLEKYRRISMTLADPRGLSEEEIDGMAAEGKAVCVQSMSLHASEIGGTHMAVNLAYHMASAEDPETLYILDNVIFVMVPCFNPDGQIMLHDWYYKNLNTPYEGTGQPSLYHKYSGHDNNRDAFAQNLIESRYMGQILFHEWMPQAYQDHHHMGSYGARIQITPYTNPLRPHNDPLLWRELNLYGAGMAYHMESEGLDGVSSGGQYPAWGHYGYHWLTNSHNIAGMLTESASAKLATPKYIHPTQLIGDGDNFQKEYVAQTNFPSPWPGGWWKLSDIVARMFHAAYGLMLTMAHNRELILKNMARKALNQTKKGEESDVYAYILSADQHDISSLYGLVELLRRQNIEMFIAKEAFVAGGCAYPAGSVVVYLAQPKMGVIRNLLGSYFFTKDHWNTLADGGVKVFDSACDTVSEYMGIIPGIAGGPFEAKLEKICGSIEPEPICACGGVYRLKASENRSFITVNEVLRAGGKVWRDSDHNFIIEVPAEMKLPDTAEACEKPCCLTPVTALKVGIYQRYYSGNADEGWLRLVLENYGFEYTSLFDADITRGGLEYFDLLILPEDREGMLFGVYESNDPASKRMLGFLGEVPPQYRSGLGEKGFKAIAAFVQKGGRLLAFGGSSDVAAKICGLNVKNVIAGMNLGQFQTSGSTLHTCFNNEHPYGYGMPKKGLIVHRNGPVFEVTDAMHADNYAEVAMFPKEGLLRSGMLTGEKYITGHSVMTVCKSGKGEVVLYGVSPHHRHQTHTTFKLLFNALYK